MFEAMVIRKIAVLGAGVMGAQIAAHCVNAGFETLLFDLPAKTGPRNDLVNKAIQHLNRLKPTPLGTTLAAEKIIPCNYEDNLDALSDCDLIIEAIGEKMEWKTALYQRIAPVLNPNVIMVTNTSGLGINALADAFPESIRHQFCGVHFFNPPRYMHLAELIPAKSTSPEILDFLESWLTSYLGKGVVRAKDTPNFIANRIGVFSLLSTIHHAQTFGLGFDEVDALTGALIGRPKSATFRTMDVVGLDTMQHVVATMQAQLTDDPWHGLFQLPQWLSCLIEQGHLGQKTGQGIYRKQGKSIEVFDLSLNDYRVADRGVNDTVSAMMKQGNEAQGMQALMASQDPQARFLAACFRDLFHYSAFHLQEIAHTVRDVDLALRWGFGWKKGPFETWQAIGIGLIQKAIDEAVRNDLALASAPLPAWLDNLSAFYQEGSAFSPQTTDFAPPPQLPVYQRQIFPAAAINGSPVSQNTLFENDGVRLWVLQDAVTVVNFKTKSNTIGQSVLDGLNAAIDIVEKNQLGLIMYQHDASNFSSGADLRQIAGLIQQKEFKTLSAMVEAIQQVCMRLKYTSVPTVAAVRGRVLGGGCELMLYCDNTIAAFETYPGLVEAGVGLIPAGGGSTAFAKRAAEMTVDADLMPRLQGYFEQLAMAKVAGSAPEALAKGFFKADDHWVMNADEVLFAACAQIQYLQAMNYKAPMPSRFPVAGREGKARLQIGLVNWLEGGFISKHDYFLANQLAHVLCGGDVNQGEIVNEAWMLHLEKEAFMTLAQMPETQARIQAILETGKPLRN